jgi:hypothetical protein
MKIEVEVSEVLSEIKMLFFGDGLAAFVRMDAKEADALANKIKEKIAAMRDKGEALLTGYQEEITREAKP